MTPTVFGYLVVAAALVLMPASITSMLTLVLISSLFAAASAINLPSLGGASVTPASLAILFLVLRVALSPAGRFPVVARAVQQNAIFAFFCVYGAATAVLLPQLFSHTINVPQLRATADTIGDLFATSPVQFSSQNITTAVYLLGTFLASLAASIACGLERQNNKLLDAIAFISWCHIGFGILDIVLSMFGLRDWLDIFRNGSYLQLNQDIGGIQRVSGIFPEPSAYAAYGFGLLVVNSELWLRNVKALLTGTTALMLLLILLMTTSSTAYVSVAVYAIVLIVRVLFTPMQLPLSKKIALFVIAAAGTTVLLALEVFMPAMSALMLDILQQMTLQKLNTISGMQRTFWAHEGWDAFWSSDWIGIGAGSFRSSGLISAVAGSFGLLGLLALLGSVWTVLRPLQRRTYDVQVAGEGHITAAFGWAAAVGLVPQLIGAPTPDPGLLFGIFSGIAVSQLDAVRAVNRRVAAPATLRSLL